eukprot:TRINITY_DN20277_c0_g1_i1.p1 TRINITY_DN20277_c0_g1~~TRINITY_DN20277_c0_g1_i1.p1  ORF type:complete len:206 (+),score=58.81 TRINITY_DN20277_c0_g1_i1:40-618(+)
MADEAGVREADRMLFEAARRGAVHEVARLLAAGAQPTAYKDYMGRGAVDIAAERGRLEVVMALLGAVDEGLRAEVIAAGGEEGEDCVASAAANGHLAMVEYLVALLPAAAVTPQYLALPLSLAAYNGHLPVVQFLVARGAHLDIPDRDGTTPVQAAAEYGKAHPKQKRLPRHDATYAYLSKLAAGVPQPSKL